MRELFVYYRVRIGQEANALAIIETFQAGLRQQRPGLIARLLRRPAESGAAQTWMETYALTTGAVGDGIDIDCERLIEAAAASLAGCIDGERHTEVFFPIVRA